MTRMTRPVHGDDGEQDAFTGWRCHCRYFRRELRKIKRRASKRDRREGHRQAEEGRDD